MRDFDEFIGFEKEAALKGKLDRQAFNKVMSAFKRIVLGRISGLKSAKKSPGFGGSPKFRHEANKVNVKLVGGKEIDKTLLESLKYKAKNAMKDMMKIAVENVKKRTDSHEVQMYLLKQEVDRLAPRLGADIAKIAMDASLMTAEQLQSKYVMDELFDAILKGAAEGLSKEGFSNVIIV